MSSIHTSERPPEASTHDKILDAAELLFITHGFAATSLRAVAMNAGVNLAATNYHFGSKMGLFSAVFHRRVQPINELRLLNLKCLNDSDHLLTPKLVLQAFFSPICSLAVDDAVPSLIGRVYSEPESLTKPILEQEFGEVAKRFQQALANVLPNIESEDLRWCFHFMIGSMIQLLRFRTPIGSEYEQRKFTEVIEELIDYSVAGFEQANNRNTHD